MARGPIYEVELHHRGLNTYRHIRGSDPHVVRQKALIQERTWEEMWEKKQEAEKKNSAKESAAQAKEEKRHLAEERTREAHGLITSLRNTLAHTLTINDAINWDSLLSNEGFQKNPPRKPAPDDDGIRNDASRLDPSHAQYQPRFGLLGWIFPFVRRRRRQAAQQRYLGDLKRWEDGERDADVRYEQAIASYEKAQASHQMQETKFYEDQENRNNAVLRQKSEYLSKIPDAIVDYCEMVLNRSVYPDFFPKEFDFEYSGDNGHLIVDYSLPDVAEIPRLKEVRYVQSRDDFHEGFLSDRELNELYDDLLYQIALRTIHELFEADVVDAVQSASFNGIVTSLDRATGHNTTKCILSIQAQKSEFNDIALDKVDPKACFKALKGIASSKLHSITPIAPIAVINKEDRRFVDPYSVVEGLDDSMNLAAMDWEDFEHLIRELFELEFKQTGGEVKVTRASKDGGVDAVAFDPDPIRGGKIVIQAKRYTNTVGVSAVRDLYGTVMNEGATKGILVTTATYGPDAYEFAKGKPLTLLSGSNLLHLLEKHGRRAKIDMQAAKEQMRQ